MAKKKTRSNESQIIRRPDFAGGGVTDEELALMKEHTDVWINNALQTGRTDQQRAITAINNLYAAADLPTPIVVVVPSPIVMCMAGAILAAYLEQQAEQSHNFAKAANQADVAGSASVLGGLHATASRVEFRSTANATDDATLAAIDAATHAATYAAIDNATRAATYSATRAAIDNATRAATYDATLAATVAATYNATRNATANATLDAIDDATRAAIDAATDVATRNVTYSATINATRDAIDAATRAATRDATLAAIDNATYSATRAAIDNATANATRNVTYSATINATRDAIDAATRAAIDNATYNAVHAAIDAATDAATYSATYAAIDNATVDVSRIVCDISRQLGIDPEKTIEKLKEWTNTYQGGNMWSAYDCYLTAARDVLGLRLPAHKLYGVWEEAAKVGGFRCMHPQFCLVSDFPDTIKKDDEHRPHCEDGPSHVWCDGWKLWHLEGHRVDSQLVLRPETQTIEQIEKEENQDLKAIRIARYGWDRYLKDTKSKCLDEYDNVLEGTMEALYKTPTGETRLVATCATGRLFSMGVPADIKTCEQARLWRQAGRKIKLTFRT